MDSKFYLSRILYTTNNQEFNESELLLVEKKVIIVLAEPGAGKSYLLDSLAKQIGVTKNTANIFIHSNEETCSSLVIDGFDELVKIGSSTVMKALTMVKNTLAERIILSSRSSEWSEGYIHYCKTLFNEEPLLVYLKPFDEKEQKDLFLHYHPQQNVEQFLEDAVNIELTPLLANPLKSTCSSKE